MTIRRTPHGSTRLHGRQRDAYFRTTAPMCDDAFMTEIRLDHVSVTCADLDRSISFYRDVLGLAFLGRGESDGKDLSQITGLPDVRLRWAELDLGGGQLLELLQYTSPVGGAVRQRTNEAGSGHIGLAVDDIDAVYRRLVGAGATVRSEPVEISEAGDWDGVRSMYLLDPDGVTIELVERPSVEILVELPEAEALRTESS
jgi:catechol 2,3-dioxygenase-like lactoylglutathione lyase family enzyme